MSRRVLRRRQKRERVVAVGEELREAVAKGLEPRAGLEAEDRLEDDLERERLKARVKLHLAVVPPLDLVRGHAGDEVGQALHALAVERGQHQLSLRHVRVAVEEEDRGGADEGQKHARPDARHQHVGRRGEDLLDLLGISDDHERRREREAGGEAVPVLGPVSLEP